MKSREDNLNLFSTILKPLRGFYQSFHKTLTQVFYSGCQRDTREQSLFETTFLSKKYLKSEAAFVNIVSFFGPFLADAEHFRVYVRNRDFKVGFRSSVLFLRELQRFEGNVASSAGHVQHSSARPRCQFADEWFFPASELLKIKFMSINTIFSLAFNWVVNIRKKKQKKKYLFIKM